VTRDRSGFVGRITYLSVNDNNIMFMDDTNPMDPGVNPAPETPAEPMPETPAEPAPAAPEGEPAAPEGGEPAM